jgi:2-keto-4-pentenoate hydratase
MTTGANGIPNPTEGGRAAQAAALLIAARGGERLPALPPDLAPRDAAEAYAIQDAVLARLGAPVGWPIGWKVGAKTPTAEPASAPMLPGTVLMSPARLVGPAIKPRAVECEFAFRLGRSLPPEGAPYTREAVLDAIDALVPAMEVLDSRYRDPDALERISVLADNLSSGAFVLGEPILDWRRVDLARQPARLVVDGAVIAETVDANPAGDPLRLVAWLANALPARGLWLKAGTVVSTGSLTGIVPVGPGAATRAEFPGLGQVEVGFTEA